MNSISYNAGKRVQGTANRFISEISSNEFAYTKWRENLWEDLTPRELFERASKTEENYNIPKGAVRIRN